MSAIGNLIYETTGLLSKRGLMKRAAAIGRDASEIVMREGTLTSENASKILAQNLGKRAKKITVATNRADASKAIADSQGIPEELAGAYYDSAASISVPGLKGKNTVIGLRVDILPKGVLSGTFAHESEHALNQTFSVRAFLERLYAKTPWGKKLLNYYLSKAEMINTRQIVAQNSLPDVERLSGLMGISENPATKEGILKQCGFGSLKELREAVRKLLYEKEVLRPNEFENNRLVSKAMKVLFKDEARAYRVGGQTERTYKQMQGIDTQGQTSLCELHSRFYDEVIKVARREEWHAKLNKWKVKLGLKPNTKREEKIMEEYEKANEKIMAAIKEESKETQVPVDVIKRMYDEGTISKGLAKKLGIQFEA